MVHGIAYEYNGRRVELDPMMQVERNFNMRRFDISLRSLWVKLKKRLQPTD